MNESAIAKASAILPLTLIERTVLKLHNSKSRRLHAILAYDHLSFKEVAIPIDIDERIHEDLQTWTLWVLNKLELRCQAVIWDEEHRELIALYLYCSTTYITYVLSQSLKLTE